MEEVKGNIEALESEINELSKIDEDFIRFVRFSLKFLDERLDVWKVLDRANRIKCKQLAFPGEIIVDFSGKVCTPQISPFLKLISTKKEAENASNFNMVEVGRVALPSKRLKTDYCSKLSLDRIYSNDT